MQEREGEHVHRGGGGKQLQRGGGYEVQHREEDGEESKAGEQLQEDPDEDVCKEEMQEGDKSQKSQNLYGLIKYHRCPANATRQ